MNPLIYKEAADAAEVVGKVPEPKYKEKNRELAVFEQKSLSIADWKLVIDSLSQFRESSHVKSISQDASLKRIIASLKITPPQKLMTFNIEKKTVTGKSRALIAALLPKKFMK